MRPIVWFVLWGPSMALATPDVAVGDASVPAESGDASAGSALDRSAPAPAEAPAGDAVQAPSARPAGPAPKPDVDAADADFAAGRYAAARDRYAEAVAAQPDAFGLRYRLAIAYAAAGQPAEAEVHAAHAARLDPGNPAARALAAGLAAARIGGEAPPGLADARRALAQGRLRAAERDAATALQGQVAPSSAAELHLIRGRALSALGRQDEALQAMQAAAALGEVDPRIWLVLAERAAKAGDRPLAARYRARATSTLGGPLPPPTALDSTAPTPPGEGR